MRFKELMMLDTYGEKFYETASHGINTPQASGVNQPIDVLSAVKVRIQIAERTHMPTDIQVNLLSFIDAQPKPTAIAPEQPTSSYNLFMGLSAE